MIPTVVALDLGAVTGWALSVSTCPIMSGTINLKPNRYEGIGMRYLRFRACLAQRVALKGVFYAFYHPFLSCLVALPYASVQAPTALVSCHALIVSRDALLRPGSQETLCPLRGGRNANQAQLNNIF